MEAKEQDSPVPVINSELNEDAEFRGSKEDQEDLLLTAQRYLNIFHQIHIFKETKRNEFDKQLLEMPEKVRQILAMLPGGRILLEHMAELEINKGIHDTSLNNLINQKTPTETSAGAPTVQTAPQAAPTIISAPLELGSDFTKALTDSFSTYSQNLQKLNANIQQIAVQQQQNLPTNSAAPNINFTDTISTLLKENSQQQMDVLKNFGQTLSRTLLESQKEFISSLMENQKNISPQVIERTIIQAASPVNALADVPTVQTAAAEKADIKSTTKVPEENKIKEKAESSASLAKEEPVAETEKKNILQSGSETLSAIKNKLGQIVSKAEIKFVSDSADTPATKADVAPLKPAETALDTAASNKKVDKPAKDNSPAKSLPDQNADKATKPNNPPHKDAVKNKNTPPEKNAAVADNNVKKVAASASETTKKFDSPANTEQAKKHNHNSENKATENKITESKTKENIKPKAKDTPKNEHKSADIIREKESKPTDIVLPITPDVQPTISADDDTPIEETFDIDINELFEQAQNRQKIKDTAAAEKKQSPVSAIMEDIPADTSDIIPLKTSTSADTEIDDFDAAFTAKEAPHQDTSLDDFGTAFTAKEAPHQDTSLDDFGTAFTAKEAPHQDTPLDDFGTAFTAKEAPHQDTPLDDLGAAFTAKEAPKKNKPETEKAPINSKNSTASSSNYDSAMLKIKEALSSTDTVSLDDLEITPVSLSSDNSAKDDDLARTFTEFDSNKPIETDSSDEWEFVDENGNPIDPSDDDEWEYVDENGNPIDPSDDDEWEYVDENGNPINPSDDDEWEYVDENGNPIAPSDDDEWEYVDENGNVI